MDRLEQAIEDKRQMVANCQTQVNAWQRKLDIARAELQAFEMAARLRPADGTPKKGRQPGAISSKWREVLRRTSLFGPSNYAAILEIARGAGVETDLANVRDRVRYFVENGFMTGDAEAGFAVTDSAIARFELDGGAIQPDIFELDEQEVPQTYRS